MKNLCLVFWLVFWLYGCAPEGPVVYVTLEYTAPVDGDQINSVTMTSGAYKLTVGEILPGKKLRAKLYPTAEATMNELSLFIYMRQDNNVETWEGKRFPIGSSYRTHIRINGEGKVLSQRSCVMPCEMD